ncbi:unnamed protein product, partial [Sphacelaria rigidula]
MTRCTHHPATLAWLFCLSYAVVVVPTRCDGFLGLSVSLAEAKKKIYGLRDGELPKTTGLRAIRWSQARDGASRQEVNGGDDHSGLRLSQWIRTARGGGSSESDNRGHRDVFSCADAGATHHEDNRGYNHPRHEQQQIQDQGWPRSTAPRSSPYTKRTTRSQLFAATAAADEESAAKENTVLPNDQQQIVSPPPTGTRTTPRAEDSTSDGCDTMETTTGSNGQGSGPGVSARNSAGTGGGTENSRSGPHKESAHLKLRNLHVGRSGAHDRCQPQDAARMERTDSDSRQEDRDVEAAAPAAADDEINNGGSAVASVPPGIVCLLEYCAPSLQQGESGRESQQQQQRLASFGSDGAKFAMFLDEAVHRGEIVAPPDEAPKTVVGVATVAAATGMGRGQVNFSGDGDGGAGDTGSQEENE